MNVFRLIVMFIEACHWQRADSEKPVADANVGTSFRLVTLDLADTCIGRALRGRPASHAPLLSV